MNIDHAVEQKRQWEARNIDRAKVLENILDVRHAAQETYRTSVNEQSTKRQLSQERTSLVGNVASVLRKHGIQARGLAAGVALGKKLTPTQFYALPKVYAS